MPFGIRLSSQRRGNLSPPLFLCVRHRERNDYATTPAIRCWRPALCWRGAGDKLWRRRLRTDVITGTTRRPSARHDDFLQPLRLHITRARLMLTSWSCMLGACNVKSPRQPGTRRGHVPGCRGPLRSPWNEGKPNYCRDGAMKRITILAVAVSMLPLASGCCCWRSWTSPTPTYAASPVVAPAAPACDPCQTSPAPPVSYGYSPAYAAPAFGTTPYSAP